MDTLKETSWHLAGMHCPHCDTAVLRAVRDLDGIREARADYRTGTLTALWDEARLPESRLREQLAEAGYTLKERKSSLSGGKRVRILLPVPVLRPIVAG